MHSARTPALFLFILTGAALFVSTQFALQTPPASSATSPASLLDDSVASFRVLFGVTDGEPRAWDGSVTAASGEILGVRNWRPHPGDKIVNKESWSLSTRKGPNFQRRAWEEEVPAAPSSYLLVPGLIIDVKGNSGTKIRFRTKNGEFEVLPFDLRPGSPVQLLAGSVVVDRVATAQLLSSAEYENDFASILSGPGGEVWTTWVAYRNKGNEILARRFDGKTWEATVKVSPQPGDFFLAKLGRDRNRSLWVVWSAQSGNNWDLVGRRYDGRAWSPPERLTDDPQPDIYHSLATDSNGNLWLVWQGFRSGKSDIFARRYDGSSWSSAERLSVSPANDWEPSIAADKAGRVYVGWDTYNKGNYDVLMRRFESGKWSDITEIAGTPKFEAHLSLACDGQDRLWAAWNESGMQWGKDSGFLVKKEATRLYQWRSVAVAIHTEGAWHEPAVDIERSLPQDLQGYNDLPVLASDGAGRVWLFFRHRTLRIRDTHNNTPAHRAAWELWGTTFEGERWLTPMPIPFSQGRTDMRAGFASDGRGNLYAAWVTDNRNFEEFLFQRADVYTARIPTPAQAMTALKMKPRVQPQIATFPVHANEPQDLSRIRAYAIQSEGRTYRIYRGDTHRHTEFSMDGNNDGSLMDTYRYAMDASELDFLGVSEHNGLGGPDREYINWLLQQAADLLHVPGTFTPLFAYERSLPYPNGHRNVVFAERGNPTLPIPAEEQQGKTGAAALYEYLKRYRGIAISHTSATNMGTDWRDNDPEVEPLVEIYQGDRVSAEYEGAPKAAHRDNPASAPGGFRPLGYVWNAWAKGYKLGVQVSSDHLAAHTSYACTLASEFTREGLMDGMRRRHSYGATDNIILDYRLQAAGKEYLQGDIVKSPGQYRLRVKVIGTAAIRQIDIIKNNKFILTQHPLEKEVTLSFMDQQVEPGTSYYYVRVIQVDDQMAWSSPIWLTYD